MNIYQENVLQVGRALFATLEGASRLGKALYTTWDQLTSPISPETSITLEDEWQMIDDADFSDCERPVRPRAKLRTVEEMMQETEFERESDDLSTARLREGLRKETAVEVVGRYREIEKKLRKAIMRGDEASERIFRTQLSHCRRKITKKETEQSGGWSVASTYGTMADAREVLFKKIQEVATQRSVGPAAYSIEPPADIVTEPEKSPGDFSNEDHS